MTSGSKVNLIIGVVLALAVLFGLNIMIGRNSPTGEHSDEPEASASPASQSSAVASTGSREATALAGLGEVKTFGKPTASNEIVVGWQWTPEVQANPEKVYRAIQAVEGMVNSSRGRFKARIVNTDVDPSVTPGVSLNKVLKLKPRSDGTLDVDELTHSIMQ